MVWSGGGGGGFYCLIGGGGDGIDRMVVVAGYFWVCVLGLSVEIFCLG